MNSLETTPLVTNLHIGESSADLSFGSSKMPRIALVNQNGDLVYLGHPEKLDLKASVETLLKGEPLALDEKLLEQDNYSAAPKPLSAMTEACEVETGTYSEDLKLQIVREEQEKVTASLKMLLQ